MFEVHIYLETSLKGPGTREGWYAAVVAYKTKHRGIETREDFEKEKELTYHKSVLRALIKSLKRLNVSCHLHIHTDSCYLINHATNDLKRWKENGFLNIKNEPIKNRQEWQQLAELLEIHELEFYFEKRNEYSKWIRSEAERKFTEKP